MGRVLCSLRLFVRVLLPVFLLECYTSLETLLAVLECDFNYAFFCEMVRNTSFG